MDDAELLCRYAETADQAAFATLVERRLPLVYSAALRQVGGDAHLARDVAQSVFADLARKAATLAGRPVLAGWLYTSTCYAAAKIVRAEQRRRRREREATVMEEMTRSDAPPADWAALRGVIDEAMRDLNDRDREAVLLRFFENRGFAEIGERLRVGENGARMRVERALDKLHAALARRGIRSSAAALGAVLATEAVVAAPSGLAAAVAAAAPAASTAGAVGLLMSVTKLQWAAGAVVLAAGVLTGVVQQRANAALERDVAALRSVANEIRAEDRRLRAPSSGSDELERLRAEAGELPALERRLRERSDEWRKLQEAGAAARPRRAPTPPRADDAARTVELDAMPRPLAQAAPIYPAALREFGIAGRATVSFVVDANGDVVGAKVVSSTHSAFDEPALEALRQWKFAPGRKGGRTVNTRLETAIVFTMQHEGDDWF
ncbi:MAG: TonB family protein [Opitutae bacterium]|nr:TonB family protein [Opitutae bacterium]